MKKDKKKSIKRSARANLEAIGWDGDSLVRSWIGQVAPTVADKAETFVFGDLYSLTRLPVRYRELLISAIIAAGGSLPDGGVQHLKVAVRNGATAEEVDEMFAMIAAYAGFPKALAAARAYQQSLTNTEECSKK